MKKIFLFLTISLFLISCEDHEPNHDKRETSGETYYVGESPSLNVYDVEYDGYKLLVFKEIYNQHKREQIISVMLNPKYEQPPIYRLTVHIDTIASLSSYDPVKIDLNDPVKIDLED